MEALEIIEMIRKAEKKTPVRVTLQESAPCEFTDAEVFSGGNDHSLVRALSGLEAPEF